MSCASGVRVMQCSGTPTTESKSFPLCDVKEPMKGHKQAKELRFSQVSNWNSKLEVLEERT